MKIQIQQKKKKKPIVSKKQQPVADSRMDRLETMIEALAAKKAKKKPKRKIIQKKTILQMPSYPTPQPNNPMAEHFKFKLLNL